MSLATLRPDSVKLSICISTRNRGALIGATLESILFQATCDCEVVVLDAASTDDTERVVSAYAQKYKNLRYCRQSTNNGVDRDFDHVVQLAEGEYCWLMPDDDLVNAGAVAIVLNAISHDYNLIVANIEAFDSKMLDVQRPGMPITADTSYGPDDIDRLFTSCISVITYIGSVIVRRSIWLARKREPYYGSGFIHIGVLFQERSIGRALLLAKPLIRVRIGNQSWMSRYFEVTVVDLPAVVRSLAVSDSIKKGYDAPWSSFIWLLFLRGMKAYTLAKYRKYVRPHVPSMRGRVMPLLTTAIPCVLANVTLLLWFSFINRRGTGEMLAYLKTSPANVRNVPMVAFLYRKLGPARKSHESAYRRAD